MRTLTASLLIALLLSACGLKGPLYLPQKESPSPQPQPQSQPQQSQDEEKDK
ncbi:lipoprotein [Nitrosovibrio sp. Nv6]|uniref:LPS translocon maturation chaperone LptM n=1 Tax=Nitrosovibrio sp. Nv6 TaxID=1855340 RepID=UPI000EB4D637|nr:lipoprotein [Nitrosovibrio sp. Nv6]